MTDQKAAGDFARLESAMEWIAAHGGRVSLESDREAKRVAIRASAVFPNGETSEVEAVLLSWSPYESDVPMFSLTIIRLHKMLEAARDASAEMRKPAT